MPMRHAACAMRGRIGKALPRLPTTHNHCHPRYLLVPDTHRSLSKTIHFSRGGHMAETSKPTDEADAWSPVLQADFERLRAVGEECISEAELRALLRRKAAAIAAEASDAAATSVKPLILYDGFEPSGRMHIAQGVFKAVNVNACTATAACPARFVFWVADWFALMNDKMGGSLERIQTVGHYLIQVWKAAGMNLDRVEFKWASHEITQHAARYWPQMLDIARRFTVTRIKKCCQIMGRLENTLTAAQVLYPLMQCTDVFFLGADICQLGVDQRKVNMLAREYCEAAGRKIKPIILSHHMLYGLKAGQEKMSKSDPDSAIFMEDAAADVARKIHNAYCPSVEQAPASFEVAAAAGHDDVAAGDTADAGKASMHLTVDTLKNPCLDYIQHIIFSSPEAFFEAAGTTYHDFASVKAAFLDGAISEEALKQGLIEQLNRLLDPVRHHFATDPEAKRLLQLVQQYKKEAASMAAESSATRRLNLVELGHLPSRGRTHLVFAPLPTASPTLQQAMDVLTQLKHHTAGDSDETTDDAASPLLVLFLSDWSATVCNACGADAKAIAAYYTVLLAALRALDADLMGKVHVIWQSQAILADPSNYWISVIHIGRHFPLSQVMGANMSDSECVGTVIARLMKVADIMGVQPSTLALLEDSGGRDHSMVEQELVQEFYRVKLNGVLPVPTILLTTSPRIRLQVERESEALVTENDEYYLLDDPKVHGKSKLKKAFCEPGNIGFCPPIQLASVFAIHGPSRKLVVTRSLENGGDATYETIDSLEKDFASGALHPGDLKAAVTSVMVSILEQLSTALKVAEAAKAAKDLKAYQKKVAKKK